MVTSRLAPAGHSEDTVDHKLCMKGKLVQEETRRLVEEETDMKDKVEEEEEEAKKIFKYDQVRLSLKANII